MRKCAPCLSSFYTKRVERVAAAEGVAITESVSQLYCPVCFTLRTPGVTLEHRIVPVSVAARRRARRALGAVVRGGVPKRAPLPRMLRTVIRERCRACGASVERAGAFAAVHASATAAAATVATRTDASKRVTSVAAPAVAFAPESVRAGTAPVKPTSLRVSGAQASQAPRSDAAKKRERQARTAILRSTLGAAQGRKKNATLGSFLDSL